MELGHNQGIGNKPKTFGKYIEQRRTLKSMHVTTAAKSLGMKPDDLTKIEENGVNKCTRLGTIVKIANFYGIPPMLTWNLVLADVNKG